MADHWDPFPRNDDDERRAREQAQNHPPSMAAVLGEDLGPPVFQDAGPSYFPDERSSAARHARGVQDRERAAAERRDLDVVLRAADELKDDKALEQVAELTDRKANIPHALLVRAARAARRNGTTIPTAEQHAAKALRGRN